MSEHLTRCLLCGDADVRSLDAVAQLSCCRSCGYVFDNPRPTPEEIDSFYSRPIQYDDWLARLPEREKTWERRLRKVLRHAHGGSLLDIGAGVGQFLALARGIFAPVAGTEVSTAAVDIAKARFNIDVMAGRVETLDFGDRKFTAITLFHVLEHVHDPGRTLETCRNLLAPAGLLVIAVPNELASLRRHMRRLVNMLGFKRVRYEGELGIPRIRLDGSLPEIHLSHFTEAALAAALERHGFDVIEKGLDPYWVSGGLRALFDRIYYCFCLLVRRITGINRYDTLWMVGRKR